MATPLAAARATVRTATRRTWVVLARRLATILSRSVLDTSAGKSEGLCITVVKGTDTSQPVLENLTKPLRIRTGLSQHVGCGRLWGGTRQLTGRYACPRVSGT